MINAISPIDGRYAGKTIELQQYFSEEALIRYRTLVEIRYFIFLHDINIIKLTNDEVEQVESIINNFSTPDAERVKEIEKTTNHDVKAVEYLIKEKLDSKQVATSQKEFIHFGLTSQDVNNTAMPLMLKDAVLEVIIPTYEQILSLLHDMARAYIKTPLLSRTHGQAASPTTMGKEMKVYADRLKKQVVKLKAHTFEGKFGGATGNFNAHYAAYPDINWADKGEQFLQTLGLVRQQHTTQIDQYDNFAEVFHLIARANTILVDFCQDIWTYVSRDFFKQKVVAGEVGSSAMPHKVNPIDFENAEGNMLYANAILEFLARKLPVSRLQRDLTDSTVTRNIGVPLAHTLVALKSLKKGIGKLEINNNAITQDLDNAWPVVSEAIQTILRREAYPNPYEALKSFSRGKGKMTKEDFVEFINALDISDNIKDEMLQITPHNYIGDSSRA